MGSTFLPVYAQNLVNKIAQDNGFNDGFTSTNTAGCALFDGFASDIIRVTINGSNRNKNINQMRLIVKVPPENEARRSQLSSNVVFEREIFVYNEFFAAIQKFQMDKGLSIDDGFYSFPKCYGTISDPTSGAYCLVLEDLKVSNYDMWPKSNVMTIERVEVVVKELAKLHAISCALGDQQPELFKKFSQMTDVMMSVLEKETIIFAVGLTFDRAIAAIDSNETEAIAKMKQLKISYLDDLQFCVDPKNSAPFTVICHGDCWTNNMLFANKKDTNELDRVSFIDWQMSRLSSPVLDLLYFIFTSTLQPFRDEHYDNIIKLYHKTLVDTINRLGSDAQKFMQFNDLMDQLRKFGKFSIIMSTMQLERISTIEMPDVNEIAESLDIGKRRNDLHLLDDKHSEKFNKRMTDVVKDCIKLGYF